MVGLVSFPPKSGQRRPKTLKRELLPQPLGPVTMVCIPFLIFKGIRLRLTDRSYLKGHALNQSVAIRSNNWDLLEDDRFTFFDDTLVDFHG